MRVPIQRTAIAATLLGIWAASASAQSGPPKRLVASPRGDDAIVLDGRLDEAAWARAAVGTGFVEREPFPGRLPAEVGAATELRVLYDAEALYVGVTSFLTEGEVPRAFELTRDSFNVFSDDAVTLKIDVRLDKRTTIGFVTTPAGTQVDYVAVENGDGFRREFDAIWEVETSTQADRWVAEFRLPFVALSLPGEPGQRALGLQVTRDHNARQATYDWAEMPPQFGPVSALYYGRLEGLDGVAGGTPLTIIPYGLTGYDGVEEDFELKAGGDVRLRLGDDTWGELTILTDFAQVDLDDPVVNLNRFALFFPERRPFFLSGLDVFEFGAGGFSQIFFSRRIGLDTGGREVPLLGGLKVYGSQGNLRYGLLQAITGDTDDAAADNFTVARARYNWGESGHFGAMATLNGNVPALTSDELDDGKTFEPNYSVGVDGSLRAMERKLQLSGFFAGAFNHEGEMDRRGYSGQLTAQYSGLEVVPSASVSFISEDFDPVVGFVARRDLLQTRLNLYSIYRTEALGLRRVSASAFGMVEHKVSDGAPLGQRGNGYVGVEWANGVTAGLGLTIIEDVVQEDFEFSAANRTVRAGVYRGVALDFGLNSPGRRNPVGNFDYSYSSALFGGQLHQFRVSGQVSAGPHFRLELGSQINLLDFPDQALNTAVTVNGKIVITPDTRLSIDLIAQANTAADTATALLRVRWRYLPGSDVFFIYREIMNFRESFEAKRTLALKLSYRFDLTF